MHFSGDDLDIRRQRWHVSTSFKYCTSTRSKVKAANFDLGRTQVDDPYRELMQGILDSSLKQIQEGDPFQESWFLSNREASPRGLTYMEVCDYLGVNPDLFRQMAIRELV